MSNPYEDFLSDDEFQTISVGAEVLSEKSEFKFGELPLSMFIAEGKPINRKNEYMYEYIFDNYMQVLKTIAEAFKKDFNISRTRVGLMKTKNNVVPILIMHSKYSFLRYSKEDEYDKERNKLITNILDQFEDFRLSASINLNTPKIMTIISYADWDIID